MGVTTRKSLFRAGKIDRLDAEYFESDAVQIEHALQSAGARPLAKYASINAARTGDPEALAKVDPDKTFEYLEISDVDPRDGFALPAQVLCRDASPRARVPIPRNAVLLSSVRPARNAVLLADDDHARAIGSTGFVVLQAHALRPQVLFAIMKSRASVAQLVRRARASMYPALHPPDVLDIRVPSLAASVERQVVDLVDSAQSNRRNYLSALESLELEVTAFFDPMQPEQLLSDLASSGSRVLTRGEAFRGGRLDAEFHAAAFGAAEARMGAVAATVRLRDLVARADTGKTPASHEYEDDDGGNAAVLKVASLTNRGINWASVQFAPGEFLGRPGSEALNGDVVFTSSAHSAAHIARKVDVISDIPASLAGRVTFVGEALRLRLKPDPLFPPHYVAAALRGALGGEQIRRCTRGITSHVYPADVLEYVRVPTPSAAVAASLAKLSDAAHEARWSYRADVEAAVGLVDEVVARLP